MRFREYFCENATVRELLSGFKVSQGPLYHYTGRVAADGICGGEIWLTRADSFRDPNEIEHGFRVLSRAAQDVLDETERASFSDALDSLRLRLRSCFVLSLSQDSENEHLRTAYSKNCGVVIEFKEGFPQLLCRGWHSISPREGAFSSHFLVDVYDCFEGFVVYDGAEQYRLATRSCQAFRELLLPGTHVVDAYHFCNILMQCVVLFKDQSFANEVEYRVALVQKPEVKSSFEHVEVRNGRPYARIEVRIPGPTADKIRTRTV